MPEKRMSELQLFIYLTAKKGYVTDEDIARYFDRLNKPPLSYHSLTAIINSLNTIIEPEKLIATGSPPDTDHLPTYRLVLPPADD